jgi:hypothetical protein
LITTPEELHTGNLRQNGSNDLLTNQPIFTVTIARMKNKTLKPMVIQNNVFSIPRRAVKTEPESDPVNPPRPMPLFCNITLAVNAIDVIINAISKYDERVKLTS